MFLVFGMKGHNDEDILVEDDGYHLIEFFFLLLPLFVMVIRFM